MPVPVLQVALHNHNEQLKNLLIDIIKARKRKVKLEKEWHDREVEFRELERHWWKIDTKRLYTDQRVEQLSVMVELAAFAAGFQAVMLFELELPSLEEHPYNHALLSIWGLLCLTVTCTNICVVIIAIFMAIDVLDDSARESPWIVANGDEPEGYSFETAKQFHDQWCFKHEYDAKRVLKFVNYSAPVFMCNLGVTTVVKFYMSPAGGWTGFALSLCGMIVWYKTYRAYLPKVQYPDSLPECSRDGGEGSDSQHRQEDNNALQAGSVFNSSPTRNATRRNMAANSNETRHARAAYSPSHAASGTAVQDGDTHTRGGAESCDHLQACWLRTELLYKFVTIHVYMLP